MWLFQGSVDGTIRGSHVGFRHVTTQVLECEKQRRYPVIVHRALESRFRISSTVTMNRVRILSAPKGTAVI